MKKKKNNLIVLIIALICVCLLSGYGIIRSNSANNDNSNIISNSDDVNLGDLPCCSDCLGVPYCLAHCRNCSSGGGGSSTITTPKPTAEPCPSGYAGVMLLVQQDIQVHQDMNHIVQ